MGSDSSRPPTFGEDWRFITRRLVRQLMIEYEYLSGLVNRPKCWLLGHEGPVRGGFILCGRCGKRVRVA
jgi:hypothetical protein